MNWKTENFDRIVEKCGNQSRILVIGIGGGSDVISAYAIASHLSNYVKQSMVYYANTKRGQPKMTDDVQSVSSVTTGHIYQFRNQVSIPLSSNMVIHGGLAIEESLPRNQFGVESPLLFYLKDRNSTHNYNDYQQSFRQAIQALNLDLIIAVDNGGDSLAKGCDPDDRDRQMMELLIGVQGPQLIHMVVAPTIDGETNPAEMLNILKEKPPSFYLTTDFLVEPYSVLAQNLPANKTPNLLLEGLRLYHQDPNQTLLIDRPFLNKLPEKIPVYLTKYIAVYLIESSNDTL